jgi:N6-L-threonylcarbamoyladenine synthase
MESDVIILAIETSCDDTSVAISFNNTILSNLTAGQKIHELYGGVVPELASRDHQKNIIPVLHESLKQANITLNQVDAIAFTNGPGLSGSLLVGSSVAKSLALSLNKPLIAVNHMHGHILAHFIKKTENQQLPSFPFLCLTVSGGHTQIVKLNDHFNIEIIGETIDDAVGEAFDKAAKILGLTYPGGPLIDKLAQQGNPKRFTFSESKMDGYNYSFSGIKTSFLYFIQENLKTDPEFIQNNLNDICASYQHHLISVLLKKLTKAAKDLNINEIAIAGGVSANSELRQQLLISEKNQNWKVFIPPFEYCTDNAAMIAITAYYKFLNKDFSKLSVVPNPRMKFNSR